MQIMQPLFLSAAALSAVVGYSVPDIQRALNPPPVTVRSLSVLDDRCPWQGIEFYGCVIQERNIYADGVVFYVVCDPAFRRFATWYWHSDQSTHLSRDFVLAE